MKKLVIIILIAAGLGMAVYSRSPSQKRPMEISTNSPTITNAASLSQEGEYKIDSQEVNYFDDVKGFYAGPVDKGGYPGVVMIHEWWGLNDTIRTMAKRLASYGYNVLAVDLYNGKIAADASEANRMATSLNKEEAIANLKEAVTYLRNKRSTKVASLGWCFGGGQSLQLSLNDSLDATVIYYGNLVTDETQLSSIQWPVLGIFGDKDQTIPLSTVNEFQKSLNDLKVENEMHIYHGVGHAFANPTGPNYAPNETRDAWAKTIAFLNKHLK